MIYALVIVVMTSRGVAIDHVPVQSRELCESAMHTLQQHEEILSPAGSPYKSGYAVMECVPTGETQR